MLLLVHGQKAGNGKITNSAAARGTVQLITIAVPRGPPIEPDTWREMRSKL